MKLGELYDNLKRLEDADKAVEQALQALMFGGNTNTMQTKRDWLRECQVTLQSIRDEEL